MVIWKYPILSPFANEVVVEIPAGAEVLAMQIDEKDGLPHIWAKVNPTAPIVQRRFVHIGTGQEYIPEGVYLGTWQRNGYVFHVFETPIREEDQK